MQYVVLQQDLCGALLRYLAAIIYFLLLGRPSACPVRFSDVATKAMTIHKTQALSIKYIVRGCLEGVFAQGK